ncbi:MAG: multiheme C-type cytochrome [Proteobacteria bacterium]|nr:multiheme C-type cytochrome [Pseudomonadota bacterium]MBU1649926.1 multiheme C-type cytochrome [Pseudomonadota bacterium]
MRKCSGFTLLLASLCLALICACAQDSGSSPSESIKHPEITEQEKLLPCSECHQQATPEVYEQWFNSLHGIGMVKCYQCHGTYENFKVEPATSVCATCHMDMIEKCPKDQKCWACHTPHSFKRANK